MRQYQRIQPQVKSICKKHGVPYVQESVWERMTKTLAVMTGSKDMLRLPAVVVELPPGQPAVATAAVT